MTLIEKFMSISINLNSMSIAYHDKDVEECRDKTTPLDSTIFASTGVDGVHFCAVHKPGVEIDKCPIYEVSPSDGEDTVVWVSKDFLSFLSMGVAMGGFNYLAGCHLCDKDEFMDIYDISWDDEYKNETQESIKLLREHFSLEKIDNLFEYIQNSYKDEKNHCELQFLSSDIKEVELGHYNQ